jgi:ribonuclease T2
MLWERRIVRVACVALGLLVGCRRSSTTQEKPAAREEPREEGGFVARRDVDAVDQPDGRRVIAPLRRGERYRLLKRGGPERAWCKLDVGAQGGWVPCAEGEGASPVASAAPEPQRVSLGTGFAYYVLTLSWSPAFCETPAGARSPEQCKATPRHGFVVHGLWPQNEKGWPESCPAGAGPSTALVTRMLDIMPSEHLVKHEWETHGTCSGLGAEGYFAALRSAFASIHVPEAYVAPKEAFTTDLEHVESAFVAANPGLTGDSIAVVCKRDLEEVRICLDKELRPRRCGSDVRDTCRGTVRVPPR